MNKSFIVFAGLISILLLFGTGCIKRKVLIKVKADGSGNIVESIIFDNKIVEAFHKKMENQKEKMAASGMDTGNLPNLDPFYNEQLIKNQAKNFGKNITFVKAKKIDNPTSRGYIAIYAFKNIEDVKVNLGNASSSMPSMGTDNLSDKNKIQFKFKKDKYSTLTVIIPRANKALQAQETELLKEGKEKNKPILLTKEEKAQMMTLGAMYGLTCKETTKDEIVKKIFNGFSIEIDLEVEGKLIKSNASYPSKKNKNLCKLYSIDFGKLLRSDAICTKICQQEIQKEDIVKKFAKMDGLDGVTLEKKKEITLEFKSLYINTNSLKTKDTEEQKQVTNVSTKKEEIKDYNTDFKKFYKFGLPDVKDAKYVELETLSFRFSDDYLKTKAKIQGNAWLLAFDKNSGTGKFIIENAGILNITDKNQFLKDLQKEPKESDKNSKTKTVPPFPQEDYAIYGAWRKADLKQDVLKLIKFLKNANGNEPYLKPHLGKYFLFAIHLYNKGMKPEANKIADLLFKLGKGKKQIIKQALNKLADTQYKIAYEKFKGNNDWKAFSDTLDLLLNRFENNWTKRPGIEKLLKLVHKHLKGDLELPSNLTKEEKALIKELDNAKTSIFNNNSYSVWSMASIDKKKSHSVSEDDAINQITSKRMDSVPMLISLLGNEHLTSVDKYRLKSTYSSYSKTSDKKNYLDKDYDEELFKRLERPLTLDEVAKLLLIKVINKPLQMDDSNNIFNENKKINTEEFKVIAEKWYMEFKNKSDTEKAIIYFQTGNKRQKVEAVFYLINNKIKSFYKDIEAYILKIPQGKYDILKNILALKYVKMRGSEAKEFAEKYIKRLDPDGILQEQLKEQYSTSKKKQIKKNKDLDDWETKQLLKVIEELKNLTNPKSIKIK